MSAFEFLAAREVGLSPRTTALFDELVHPVHRCGKVFGWELTQIEAAVPGKGWLVSDRFERLSSFISKKMRMSHVYQPVMLLELLRHRGVASKTEIAKALLLRERPGSSTTRKSLATWSARC